MKGFQSVTCLPVALRKRKWHSHERRPAREVLFTEHLPHWNQAKTEGQRYAYDDAQCQVINRPVSF